MSKHTPGEWRYVPHLLAVVVTQDHRLKVVADFGKCDLPELDANARLIAAAPDLLAALGEALDLCALGDVDETTEAYGWGEAIKRARAAIAKAEAT